MITFQDLNRRLRERLAGLVRRGETSERRIARLSGYTQPHVHNVLKGTRRLSAELADGLLKACGLTVRDLLEPGRPASGVLQVPVARGTLGPRERFPDLQESEGFHPFGAGFAGRFQQPVLVRVAGDEESMHPLIRPGDLLLLDRSEEARRRPTFDDIWALALAGRGALCRCQVVGGALVLVADNPQARSNPPDHLPLARRNLLQVVRGRVVWLGREWDLL